MVSADCPLFDLLVVVGFIACEVSLVDPATLLAVCREEECSGVLCLRLPEINVLAFQSHVPFV